MRWRVPPSMVVPLWLLLARVGRAAEQEPTAAQPESDLVDGRSRPHWRSWEEGPPRAFVASTVDLGALYLRPRLSAGYGRPHAAWLGADVNPIANNNGLGWYAGLRAKAMHLDWRIGARGFRSFTHSYLKPSVSYQRIDLETGNESTAGYVTLETELTANVVWGPGELEMSGSLSYVTGVPDRDFVFEETLRVIAKPPWIWRGRAAYHFFVFPAAGRLSIGPVVDVLGVPQRDAVTVRIGLFARASISRSLELRMSFVPSLYSVDHLALAGGDFTELGLRYRWATGR